MALALHLSAMGADVPADRIVHPFFTVRRERADSQSRGEQIDAVEPSTAEASDLEGAPKYNPQASQDGERKKTRRSRKRKSDEDVSELSKVSQPKLNFGLREEHGLDGREEASIHTGEPEPIANDQQVLGNSPKRRKTCSPAPEETPATKNQPVGWEEQLLHAGFAGSSPPKENGNAPTSHSTQDHTLDSIPERNRVVETPPKKIIRLRSDGRLASPKTTRSGVQKAMKTEEGRAATKEVKRMLVVMRYHHEDSKSGDLGQKIDDLLTGRTRLPAARKADQKPPVSYPQQPPKTTHPFFTGKLGRGKPPAALLGPPEDSDASSTRARSASPRRPPASSKSWAGFGASFTKQPKQPGTLAALWPSKELSHVRGSVDPLTSFESPLSLPKKRLKGSEVRLPVSEEVLHPIASIVESTQCESIPISGLHFHRPRRRLMTCPELQRSVRKRLVSTLPQTPADDNHPESEDELIRPRVRISQTKPHASITHLYNQLRKSLSAFDLFGCEQREWAHKYSPTNIDQVLHGQEDLGLLREWLNGLTVNAVENRSAEARDNATKKRPKKKKRKPADDLEGFIVSAEEPEISDDSDNEGCRPESSLRRLSSRNSSRTKAVVLCGPHGCGKTASIYAAAQELSFEVFEINSGMRRSGRDLVDRVGDMTRNHLVGRSEAPTDEPDPETSVPLDAQDEVDSGQQSTMNAFFKSAGNTKKNSTKLAKKVVERAPMPQKKAFKKQKQSLILLEEVDVLFEEDKHFWSTVISMLMESRRPIIMTCTDERLLPAEELADVAVLHISPASDSDAIDYLLLVAANEGHLLSREAMAELFNAQACDLRASLVQLNFLCQMALGDAKGGLEWMLIRSNSEEGCNSHGEPLRVISEDTFTGHMPVIMQDTERVTAQLLTQLDDDIHTLEDAQLDWDLALEDSHMGAQADPPSTSFDSLKRFEQASEALSAADIMPGSSLLEARSVLIDTTHPPLSEKERAHYPEGYPLLDAAVRLDQTGLSLRIVLALKLQARPLVCDAARLNTVHLSNLILAAPPRLSDLARFHGAYLASTLSPLSIPPLSTVFTNSAFRPSPSLLPSTSPSTLASDVAPYVRSIVAADLKLEQQRVRLSGLLSQGGRDGKRARTTRAARAALEGGRKESTRKERWFGIEVNYHDVQATEGVGWANAQKREMARQAEDQPAADIDMGEGAGEIKDDAQIEE